jgi:hypothetical protein
VKEEKLAGAKRNIWRATGLVAAFALGAALLPSAPWIWGWAVLLGLAGVALLTGNRWRTSALMTAAVAIAIGLLNAFASVMASTPVGVDVVHTTDPKEWIPPEPVLGYRLLPNLTVVETAIRGGETLFRVTYTSTAEGTRTTVPAPPGADTYIFMGSSFIFGQGLPDDETLPSQFAHLNGDRIRTVNFSAPGYGINHLVRALEAGLLDHYKASGKVAAIITWITPSQLEWVTGDGEWLLNSPRYVLDHGVPRYTGSFLHHRLTNPIAGAAHLARKYLDFAHQIGQAQRQAEQADLFVALFVRLQQLAQERLGAPLYVIYSWPDDYSRPEDNVSPSEHSPLVKVLDRLREAHVPLISVDEQTRGYPATDLLIPYEGHPTLLTTRLIAAALKRRLIENGQLN